MLFSANQFLKMISGQFTDEEQWTEAGPKLMGMEEIVGVVDLVTASDLASALTS